MYRETKEKILTSKHLREGEMANMKLKNKIKKSRRSRKIEETTERPRVEQMKETTKPREE